jgi:membrane protein
MARLVLMFWTYYSAQILLFAELTKAIADERVAAEHRAPGGTIQ